MNVISKNPARNMQFGIVKTEVEGGKYSTRSCHTKIDNSLPCKPRTRPRMSDQAVKSYLGYDPRDQYKPLDEKAAK